MYRLHNELFYMQVYKQPTRAVLAFQSFKFESYEL